MALKARALAVVLTAACHRASGPAPSPTRCEPGVPANVRHPIATSRDPAQPGAMLAGEHLMLMITDADPRRILPEAAGYFCALRVRP